MVGVSFWGKPQRKQEKSLSAPPSAPKPPGAPKPSAPSVPKPSGATKPTKPAVITSPCNVSNLLIKNPSRIFKGLKRGHSGAQKPPTDKSG